MKNFVKKIPGVRFVARYLHRVALRFKFHDSESYWIQRYQSGGNSGGGSYNRLANFKAEVINGFVKERNIKTVAEYGCGDGNQLKLAEYASYIGYDVSSEALALCRQMFLSDKSKAFKLMRDYTNEEAELTLSLDVVYHLVEDEVFDNYMERLFDSSSRFVIIYASDTDDQNEIRFAHVRNRQFSAWVNQKRPQWELVQHIPNKYPYAGGEEESIASFFIYTRKALEF